MISVLSVALVAGALALAGCGGGGGSDATGDTGATGATGESTSGGTLTMLQPEPTQGFDPNTALADASRIPMAMIYETLVERDENGEIVGSLAESWEVSPDGKEYTFTLRPDVAFSDGSPITAEDVKFSFDRMQQGETMKGLLGGLESTEVVDDRTIRFLLDQPSQIFLETVGRPANAAILSKAAVETDPDYFTKPAATSGPWQLQEYSPKSHMLLSANSNYYNPPKVGTIQYTFSEDQTAHAAAIESGSADMASVGYADVEGLKADGVNVVQADLLAPLFWGWDRTKPPFDDVRVRQAVAFAVDRDGRMEACWFGTGGITYGNILRPWDPDYVELDTYKTASRDEALAKAGQLLDEAGWKLGPDGVRVAEGVAGVDDGTKLSLQVPYEGNWPAAECHVQVLQQNLQEVGMEIVPEKYDPAAYWGDVGAGKFTMYHGGAAAANAADLYANWFDSKGSLTALTTHLADPELDAKIAEALTATDPEQSKAIFQELEEWQAEELPMLVVGYQWPQVAVGSRVQGYEPPVDQDSRTLVATSVG